MPAARTLASSPSNADLVRIVAAIRAERYPAADVILAAGSLIRGEGTATSDLDLVVLYARLPCARRESFRADGFPVEAFVHDPETLEYFISTMDVPSGVPSLPRMVLEGLEVPGPTDLSRAAKARADAVLTAGPPRLDAEHEQRMRYAISDLLDDLRAPRSQDEAVAIGTRLYEQLADYHLRRLGLWSARGKGIPRALRTHDAGLAARYAAAFHALFAAGDGARAIDLAEALLAPAGGPLFEGYCADAPATWRTPR
jgi:hypothetical protein